MPFFLLAFRYSEVQTPESSSTKRRFLAFFSFPCVRHTGQYVPGYAVRCLMAFRNITDLCLSACLREGKAEAGNRVGIRLQTSTSRGCTMERIIFLNRIRRCYSYSSQQRLSLHCTYDVELDMVTTG